MQMFEFRWLQLRDRKDDGSPILVLQYRTWHHNGWTNWIDVPIEKE